MNFLDLPQELITFIFEYCVNNFKSISILSQVSKEFNYVLHNCNLYVNNTDRFILNDKTCQSYISQYTFKHLNLSQHNLTDYLLFSLYLNPTIEYLDLSGCINIKSIKGCEYLPKLTYLNISNCKYIHELCNFNKLPKLETLVMHGVRLSLHNNSLEISNTNIKYLDISSCRLSLENIPTFPKHLQSLNLNNTSFNNLELIEYLTELTSLELSRCNIYYSADSLKKFTKLITLNINSFELERFDFFLNLENLTTLSLKELPFDLKNALQDLKNITHLNLTNNAYLENESLQCLIHLPLVKLNLKYCNRITDIGISYLIYIFSLEYLNVYGCALSNKISTIFKQFKNLKKIKILNTQGYSKYTSVNISQF